MSSGLCVSGQWRSCCPAHMRLGSILAVCLWRTDRSWTCGLLSWSGLYVWQFSGVCQIIHVERTGFCPSYVVDKHENNVFLDVLLYREVTDHKNPFSQIFQSKMFLPLFCCWSVYLVPWGRVGTWSMFCHCTASVSLCVTQRSTAPLSASSGRLLLPSAKSLSSVRSVSGSSIIIKITKTVMRCNWWCVLSFCRWHCVHCSS